MISYFSKDENKRAKFIFNLIAPVYGMIDRSTKKHYPEIAGLLNQEIPLEGRSVLDVGTGTGAWIAALKDFSLSRAYGVDFSEKMIFEAKRKHPEITFSVSEATDLATFENDSFDVVTASFVMHGMKKEARRQVLHEMKRVARHFVVIQDFYLRSSPFITMLEWLERSDYRYFKKHFKDEMSGVFKQTRTLTAHNENGLYIGFI